MAIIIAQIARLVAITVAFVMSLVGVEMATTGDAQMHVNKTAESIKGDLVDIGKVPNVGLESVGSTPLIIPTPVHTFTDEAVNFVCGEKTYVVEFLACGEEIGRSVENRPIYVFEVGEGERNILFVGGLHTGTEKNTYELANKILQHFIGEPQNIPSGIKFAIIPKLNPDGIASGGHNNARGVDLNRNWPTKDWRSDSYHPTYGRREGAGGRSPLSESESKALYEYILRENPYTIFVWHSKAGTVSGNGVEPANTLASIYAEATGYNQIDEWTYYETTGTFSDAMREQGFAEVDVELATRSVEFDRNLKGVEAVLGYDK